MTGNVPPRIESPKTFIGVGLREVLILGLGGMLAIAALLSPVHLALRIGLAVLGIGFGLALAFGRDRRSGKTPEELLRDLIRFHSRAKFLQKGTQRRTHPVPDPIVGFPSGEYRRREQPAESSGRGEVPGLRVKPLPLGPGLMLSAVSLAFLAGVLAWIWLGGLAEIQAWMMVSEF